VYLFGGHITARSSTSTKKWALSKKQNNNNNNNNNNIKIGPGFYA
jgi:hypothetical protein